MKFSMIVLTMGLMLTGCNICDETIPKKQNPCTGSLVKGCSPVAYFDTNSTDMDPLNQQSLEWGLSKMNRWPNKKMLITGYADMRGSARYNLSLSKRRAESVRNYYLNNGIDPSRIDDVGRGETDLICDIPECQDVNRRVEVKIYTPGY